METAALTQNTDFLKKSFNKAVFPSMITILSANINVFVDGILVGSKIGTNALAAINVSLPVFLFMCVIGSFVTSGTAINASQEMGRNRKESALLYYRTCVISLFIISIIFTALGLLFRYPLVEFLCADKSMQPYVMEYIVITIIGAFPKIMIYIPLWYLRLDGKNVSVMVMMSVLSIGNVILDFIMVYMLNMGVFGAGLASVVATTLAFAIGVICLLQKNSTFTFSPEIIRDKSSWKRITNDGIPSAFNNLASTIRILMINSYLFAIGGGILVAVFSAVNGIYGFGEAIVLGVPQAASPMLGMHAGEKDNKSNRLLLEIEIKQGLIYSAIFTALIITLNVPIQRMYNIEISLLVPLAFMCISVFFALIGSVLQGYYNVAGRHVLANIMILLRLIVMPFAGLVFVKATGLSPFLFLVIGEAGAILVWYIIAELMHNKNPELSRFLFMDDSLEEKGAVINFSVEDEPDKICEASERISEFCADNGLSMKNTMALQLAIEELLTIISTINKDNNTKEELSYDLRAYCLGDVRGIRIRYNGMIFNPFSDDDQNEDMMMGVQMIKKLVETYEYMKTVGFNTLLILLKE